MRSRKLLEVRWGSGAGLVLNLSLVHASVQWLSSSAQVRFRVGSVARLLGAGSVQGALGEGSDESSVVKAQAFVRAKGAETNRGSRRPVPPHPPPLPLPPLPLPRPSSAPCVRFKKTELSVHFARTPPHHSAQKHRRPDAVRLPPPEAGDPIAAA